MKEFLVGLTLYFCRTFIPLNNKYNNCFHLGEEKENKFNIYTVKTYVQALFRTEILIQNKEDLSYQFSSNELMKEILFFCEKIISHKKCNIIRYHLES